MSDHTRPMTQTTSVGTANNSRKGKAHKAKEATMKTDPIAALSMPSDAPDEFADLHGAILEPGHDDTLNDFEAKIARAQMDQSEWVETTKKVIGYFNRKGMNGAEHFLYKGIKVCEYGKTEAIEAKADEDLGKRIHGDTEGTVLTGGT